MIHANGGISISLHISLPNGCLHIYAITIIIMQTFLPSQLSQPLAPRVLTQCESNWADPEAERSVCVSEAGGVAVKAGGDRLW